MNGADLIVIFALAAVVGVAVFLMIRRRTKGSGCCGDCAKCRQRNREGR